MKVWEVRLSLCNDGRGNWVNFFKVDSDNKDYTLVDGAYFEEKRAGIRNKIPSKIEVRRITGGYLAQCGFKRLPSDEELKIIEIEMKQILNDYIEDEFKKYEATYHLKIKGLLAERSSV